jgi:hypothetical protein
LARRVGAFIILESLFFGDRGGIEWIPTWLVLTYGSRHIECISAFFLNSSIVHAEYFL